jgi:hypothetical protein
LKEEWLYEMTTSPRRHLIIISTIAFTVLTLNKANLKYYPSEDEYSNSVKLGSQICEYSEDVAGPGEWISPDRWKPSIASCEYNFYTNNEFGSCISLKYRRIAFFGDSLLLAIFVELVNRLEDAGYGKVSSKPDDFYNPGGKMEFTFFENNDDGRRLVFWWTPSVFHANIRHYENDFDALDVAIFSLAVWNMGTFFQGANEFYDKYLTMINDLSEQTNVTTFVFGLHKLWPQRCNDQLGPCAKCNSDSKAHAFREAVSRVAACAVPSSSEKGKGGVIYVDTFGFTNTYEAMADGKDAVHYGPNTTSMEATHLQNVLCRDDGFARRQKRVYDCNEGGRGYDRIVDFDAVLSSGDTNSCERRIPGNP